MCIHNADRDFQENSCNCLLFKKYKKAEKDLIYAYYCQDDNVFLKKLRKLMNLQTKIIQSTHDLCIKILDRLRNSNAISTVEARVGNSSKIRRHQKYLNKKIN